MSQLISIQTVVNTLVEAYAKQQAKTTAAGTDIFEGQNVVKLSEECMLLRDQYFDEVCASVYYKERLICQITPYGLTQTEDFFAAEFISGLEALASRLNLPFAASAVTELSTIGTLSAYPIVGSIHPVSNTTLLSAVISNNDEVQVVMPVVLPLSKDTSDTLRKAILKMAVTNAMTKDIDALLV